MPLTAFFIFACVLARVVGLVALAPFFGLNQLPLHFRGLLAVAMALIIAPIQWSHPAAVPSDLVLVAVALAGELLIGLILGFGVAILLGAAQVAGQIISQMSGLSLAEVFDPSGESTEPLLAHLLYTLTLVMFVLAGGHRLLVGALLDTYNVMPLGHVDMPQSLAELTTTFLAESFSLAVRGAAPAMIGLLLASIVLGLVSRTLPQLNILAVGFGLNTLVAIAILSVSIGGIAFILQDQLEPALDTIVGALRPH